ncbi:MAG: hypothetical protein IJJ13_03895 [Lachnospiraceae bacterium]|nr:hypothetical protein [Lachnospiraceae bacterium]
MEQEKIEQKIRSVESYFIKYGASSVETKSHDAFGHHLTFEQGGVFYRVEETEMDGRTFLMISAADDPKFANVGVMEDVAAFPADLSEEQMEKEVRYVLDVEPYPENYPDYD